MIIINKICTYWIEMAEETKTGSRFTSQISLSQLSFSIWSDLAPIKTLTVPVIQFLVAQVAAQVTNRTKTKG